MRCRNHQMIANDGTAANVLKRVPAKQPNIRLPRLLAVSHLGAANYPRLSTHNFSHHQSGRPNSTPILSIALSTGRFHKIAVGVQQLWRPLPRMSFYLFLRMLIFDSLSGHSIWVCRRINRSAINHISDWIPPKSNHNWMPTVGIGNDVEEATGE